MNGFVLKSFRLELLFVTITLNKWTLYLHTFCKWKLKYRKQYLCSRCPLIHAIGKSFCWVKWRQCANFLSRLYIRLCWIVRKLSVNFWPKRNRQLSLIWDLSPTMLSSLTQIAKPLNSILRTNWEKCLSWSRKFKEDQTLDRLLRVKWLLGIV